MPDAALPTGDVDGALYRRPGMQGWCRAACRVPLTFPSPARTLSDENQTT